MSRLSGRRVFTDIRGHPRTPTRPLLVIGCVAYALRRRLVNVGANVDSKEVRERGGGSVRIARAVMSTDPKRLRWIGRKTHGSVSCVGGRIRSATGMQNVRLADADEAREKQLVLV